MTYIRIQLYVIIMTNTSLKQLSNKQISKTSFSVVLKYWTLFGEGLKNFVKFLLNTLYVNNRYSSFCFCHSALKMMTYLIQNKLMTCRNLFATLFIIRFSKRLMRMQRNNEEQIEPCFNIWRQTAIVFSETSITRLQAKDLIIYMQPILYMQYIVHGHVTISMLSNYIIVSVIYKALACILI